MTRAFRTSSTRLASLGTLAFAVLAGLTLVTARAEASGENQAPTGTFIQASAPVGSVVLDGDRLHVMRSFWFASGWYPWLGSMFCIYDPSSSATQPLGTTPFYDQPVRQAFVVQGGFAYFVVGAPTGFLGVGQSELRVVDVSDRAAPHLVATLLLPENPSCVAVSGGHAYIGTGVGLRIVDIADPTSPTLLGSTTVPAGVVSVALRGTFALVGTPDSRLTLLDVSNPLAPVAVSNLLVPGTPWDIEVRGAHAYVASGESGLQVIDVSRPGQPRLVGRASTYGDARRVAVGGARAYVADWEVTEYDGRSGLRVIDISNPTRPAMVNSISSTYIRVADVSVSDSRIALGGTVTGFECLAGLGGDCNGGFLQVSRASDNEPGAPHAFVVNGTASATFQPSASAASIPAEFHLTGNDPNPFNPQTSIRFDVPRASRVLVRIYDAQGRLVNTLEDGVLPPGRHEVSWRGQNEHGEAVASGAYFVRMDAEGFRETRKITLLK